MQCRKVVVRQAGRWQNGRLVLSARARIKKRRVAKGAKKGKAQRYAESEEPGTHQNWEMSVRGSAEAR